MKWKPLAEAPKDGTPILVRWKNNAPGRSDLEYDIVEWNGTRFVNIHAIFDIEDAEQGIEPGVITDPPKWSEFVTIKKVEEMMAIHQDEIAIKQ